MRDFIPEIISAIKKNNNSSGTEIVLQGKTIPINSSLFAEIKPINSNAKIAFVDGGNGEILNAPSFCLHFIRLYCCIYQNNKRIKRIIKEFYALITSKSDKEYEARTFNEDAKFNINLAFNSFDSSLRKGEHKVSPSSVAEHVRKLSELRFAEEIMKELSWGDIIVRDGDLESSAVYENDFYKGILSENKICLVGFSKTTKLTTNSGNSAAAVLRSMAELIKLSKWNYSCNNICFAKLHEKSDYVFRIDFSSCEKMNEIISLLSDNSCDPSFPGYPYGLIEADRFARVAKDETNRLKTLLMAKGGKELKYHFSALDAHDLLNSEL